MIITKDHVGRKVYRGGFAPLTVVAVDDDCFWGRNETGSHFTYSVEAYDWQLVEEAHCSCADQPKPKVLPSKCIDDLLQAMASKDRKCTLSNEYWAIEAIKKFLDESEVFK